MKSAEEKCPARGEAFFQSPGWKRFRSRYLTVQFAGKIAWKIVRFVILFGLAYIILYPFFIKIVNAFKDASDFADPTVRFIPKTFTTVNIRQVVQNMDYVHSLRNTVLISTLTALFQTAVSALVGYGFARFRFKLNKPLFFFVILSLIVPPQTVIIPLFLRFRFFLGFINLINTPLPLFILALTGFGIKNALYIFLFRQFFRNMPKELEEAAYLDGGGAFTTFSRVMLPSASPIILIVLMRAGGKVFGVMGWHTWKTMAGKGGSNYSGTTVEFRQNRLLASYNGRIEPGMRGANASVYSHVPEMASYKQKASKTVDISRYDPNTTYLMIYNGDYDGIEARGFYLPNLWDDEARGKLPLVWNINGSGSDASSMFFNYMYQTATANDYFVMGPNGVAYVDPENLEPAKKDAKYARKIVPDGVEQFRDYTIELSRKYDLDAAPRLIFATGGVWNDRLLKTFADIAPIGLSYWNYEVAPKIRLIQNSAGESVPMVKMVAQITHLSSENEIYENLKDCLTNPKYAPLKGMIAYEMIHVDPGTILNVVNRIKGDGVKLEVVGPYEFYAYARLRA